MKIEIKMTDEQYEALRMDLADIIWCLARQHDVQVRALRLADMIEHGARETACHE
jgi:hypothetical protein